MKVFVLLSFLCLSLQATAGGVLYVLYGSLKNGQERILNRVFKPTLEDLKDNPQITKIVENRAATHADLTRALKSPETYGVIFLGHPAIKTKGELPNKTIIHGYLQDSEGRYLPKKILSSAHPELRFLSIMTCHESAVLPLYLKYLPESVHYYKSPTHSLNSLGNPLFEFTSFYSTPKIVAQINHDLKNKKYPQFTKPGSTESSKLKVTFKDLVSQRFGYSVLFNNQYVGALFSQKNNRGRLLNDVTLQFSVPSYLERENNSIELVPDDANRPRPAGLKVVDDILVLEVAYKGTPLSQRAIHIGDQPQDPDMSEGLGFLRNREDFKRAPFAEGWELEF